MDLVGACRFHGTELVDGKPERHPLSQTALQGMYSGDASTLELERHPGARGLVRSRAVEDQVSAPQFGFVSIDVLGFHPTAARNRIRHGRHIERRAEIYDRDVLAGVEAPLERLW